VHVIATAGHVDHGKSTLVRALTGSDPDRLEEEHKRGLSIELGYCWTSLPPVGDVAFVDVPGHERFISTMLAGIGPVPAVLLVVAADDPWMPQAAEHLAALDALGVRHGVVAVTRADLADPGPAVARAAAELSRTSLRNAPVVPVSGHTGQGLDELRRALVTIVGALPAPDPAADVRLWVDRRFSIKGAGTVVTGTLPAGRVDVGDELAVGEGTVRVRALQSLGLTVPAVSGAARVALNVTGDDLTTLDRGSVLVTPGAWRPAEVVDVRLAPAYHHGARPAPTTPPDRPVLHVGATAVSAHHRSLGDDLARLTLDRPLPLRVGDRVLLRDPGSRAVWGATVLDPAPPALRRRGAAARRAKVLLAADGVPDLDAEVERRGVVRGDLLRRIGVRPTDTTEHIAAGGWLMSRTRATAARREVAELVRAHDSASPLDPGLPLAVVADRLHLPSTELVRAVVGSPLRIVDGRVTLSPSVVLPAPVERALAMLGQDLAGNPFAAPTADRLRELGLDARAQAAAAKAGRLWRVGPGIVLLPGADKTAVDRLAELPQPFTTSQARVCLGTSRRVVLPLLEQLDRTGRTRRLPDDRRVVADR
jgi:selenocysteine-specific elongation factor